MQGRNPRTQKNGETIQQLTTGSGHGTVPSLWRSFSWFFVGNAVYIVSQWGMLSVLSKLASPEIVGQFSLGLAITAPVIVFFNLQLRQVQATDAARQYKFGDYLGLRIATTMMAVMLIIAIVLVAGYRLELALVILAVGLAKVFEALSDVFFGLFQYHERMNLVSKSMMLKGVFALCALGVTYFLTSNLILALLAWAATWAVRLISYDIRNGIRTFEESSQYPEGSAALKPRWRVSVLSQLALLALPLGFSAALMSLSANVPRYFVVYYLNEYSLGIFAALSYAMVSGTLVAGALGQSSSPRLARYYVQGNRHAFCSLVIKLALVSTLLGVAGVLVSLVAGRWILSFLYTPEYAEYLDLFLWIMIATGIRYVASLLNFAMVAARYFWAQVLVLAGVVGTTAIGCLVLVPQAGVLGAGIALVFGQVFYLVANLGFLLYIVRSMRLQTSPARASEENSAI